ncbi:hypothetical protein GOBAR_AA23662 [Gossypium barbadense]|uniref:Disease resistance R13L4/SHOC-2-like LRR domain-containing protein n=1 Tax=Gossypium barbadense TaxID=3634 RepID=A0A2P5X0Z3_GOSBA|nr:hypothetical protein GOBAR_AA23662 [Gossypium barbadense]
MAKTIENLSLLSTRLSEAAKSNAGTSDKLELGAASKELSSLIEEAKEQQSFESYLSHSLTYIHMTVDDIVKDPNMENGKTKKNHNRSPKSKDDTSESFEIDKACSDIKYLIGVFKQLLITSIQNNVDDILGDLNANADNVEWETIKRNLKVLRSNMTKVQAQLPLLHQTSSSTEARRLLTTTSREEASKLPSPYQADGIFEKGSFLKDFQDRYETLGKREKLCLLCFAIFPENAEVSERLLRFWWEGERLRPESESDKKTVNEILEEFVERGFIEPVYKRSGSKGSCYKMHPIVRCLIVRHAKEANFFYYDCKGYPNMEFFKSKKICLVKSEGPSWWSKDDQERKEMEKKRAALETTRAKYLGNLQTLFNVSKQFPELPEELFPNMKNIDVLYLGRWERTAERHMEVVDVNFLRGLKNMSKLRFFSLQGISGIKKLPNSIGMLQNLRILDLKACDTLEELPEEVGLLKMLSYLDLSECYLLETIPKDLSKLSKLKVLKGFIISSNSPCDLTHLTTLSELEKLSISIHDDKFSIKEEESIKQFSKFKSLTKLQIAWGAGGIKKSADRAKHPEDKNKTSEASKLWPTAKVLEKYLKLPFLGSSKSVPKKGNVTVAAATAKAGQDKNGDNAKKKKSGAVLQSNVHANNKDQGGRSPKPVLQSELKLEKLDIRCYPDKEPPKWLVPKTLTHLKRLYFRCGELSHIPVANRDERRTGNKFKSKFPELKLLEKVNCPQITFCPCDASGAWELKQA